MASKKKSGASSTAKSVKKGALPTKAAGADRVKGGVKKTMQTQ